MGPERFEIIMNGPPGQPAPKEEFAQCQTRVFDRLEAMGLRLSPRPGRASLTTPTDFAARFPGSDGSLYGRSPAGMMAAFQRPTARTKIPGALPGGGRDPSGGGGADGLPLRPARGRGDQHRPCFDIDVPSDGYAWWYVDGISADHRRAITIIGFIGSVFSPWYRWSGRRDPSQSLLSQRGDLRARRALDDDRSRTLRAAAVGRSDRDRAVFDGLGGWATGDPGQ